MGEIFIVKNKMDSNNSADNAKILMYAKESLVSNRSLSQVISADYFRRKRLSQSAVDDADAHYIG